MSAPPLPYYTPEEYLELEEQAEYKSEYISGRIFAMAGGTLSHGEIANNVGGEMRSLLRQQPCRVYNSDVRVTIMQTGLKTYPDVTIVCGESHLHPFDKNTIINPAVIFEVLSPSTELYDRGEKWANYQRLESLQEYLLVSQHQPQIEHYIRQEDDSWVFTSAEGMDAVTMVLGVPLALAEVYEKIQFPTLESVRERLHVE
jgi:Uma2 family endonuclease